MWELHNVLWVIPGVIFIHLYNKNRPFTHESAIQLSGWPLIFALTIIASITWLPAELVAQKIFNAETETVQHIQTLLTSIFFTFILLLVVQIGSIARIIFPSVHDNFHNRCVEWENKSIILTLKNGKAYIGILWKYPESPKSRYESQTISIIPLQSGYREMEKKCVQWTTYYPYDQDPDNMETIIPRHEILTFGKFNIKAHQYFEELKTSKES